MTPRTVHATQTDDTTQTDAELIAALRTEVRRLARWADDRLDDESPDRQLIAEHLADGLLGIENTLLAHMHRHA